MLKVAKIFIILGMVFGGILVYPVVVGVLTLKKMKTAKNNHDLLVHSVLTLVFVSTIAGIFLLLAEDKDFKEYQELNNTKLEEEEHK